MYNKYFTIITIYKDKEKFNKLIIKKFPKNNVKKYINFNNNANGKYLTKKLHVIMQKCIDILSWHNNINKDYLIYQKGNIYCPFHENPKTSHSKSAKLWIKNNIYVCFSNQCIIPKNKNGNCVLSTSNFLKLYHDWSGKS